MTPLEVAYESACDRMTVNRDWFLEAFAEWSAYPVMVSGELVGTVLMNGQQIHACIRPEGFRRWLTKKVLNDTLFTVLRRHGRAVTSVTAGNAVGDRFVRRLGFTPFKEENGIVWYEVKNGH